MKRSEMIDEIMCVLLAHSAKYPQFPLDNLKEASELILQMQEKVGMLPPAQDSKVYDENGNLTKYTSHNWDKE